MKTLQEINPQAAAKIQFILTDIDDTLTNEGQLLPEAYAAMWALHRGGFHVIPITGRPAGWCEMIARLWPVSGIIGENGGFYFRYHEKKMIRKFFFDEKIQTENRKKLKMIETEILTKVQGSATASDQFCRLMDLAIDFCEDVPALEQKKIDQIVEVFHDHGAQAKVSSIHVNGWFGDYDKKQMTTQFLAEQFNLRGDLLQEKCAFIGDSPNDEPLFEFLNWSFAVSNFKKFETQVKNKPQFIASSEGGKGFEEIAQTLLKHKK